MSTYLTDNVCLMSDNEEKYSGYEVMPFFKHMLIFGFNHMLSIDRRGGNSFLTL